MARILVADDDPDLLMLVGYRVGKVLGHAVQAHPDGAGAWQALQHEQFDLVIVDNQMPGLTGLEVTHLCRQHPTLSGVKIIMITANAQDSDRARGMAAGVDVYLTKPFALRALDAAVDALLGA